MRNKLVILCLILFALPCFAEDILVVGDSIGNGSYRVSESDETYYETENRWTQLKTSLGHADWTHSNQAQNSWISSQVDSNMSSWIAIYSPSYVYSQVGTNDIFAYTLEQYLGYYASILTKCGSTPLIVSQIPPRGDINNSVRLWNAALEEWCRTSNIKMSGVWWDLCDTSTTTYDGYLNPDLSSDYSLDRQYKTHMTLAGYTLMGTIDAQADVPSQKRVWGGYYYPKFSYISWKWWVTSGTASISGDADKGDLSLPAYGDYAVSTVECMPTGTKTINIAAPATGGTATISYRTANTTFFTRGAAGSFTTYSGAFSTSHQFIQIKVTNLTASAITVGYAAMTWSGSAPGDESDPDTPPSSTYNIINSALGPGGKVQ